MLFNPNPFSFKKTSNFGENYLAKNIKQDKKPSSDSKKNKVSLRIENVVASINLRCELPLDKILEKYKPVIIKTFDRNTMKSVR